MSCPSQLFLDKDLDGGDGEDENDFVSRTIDTIPRDSLGRSLLTPSAEGELKEFFVFFDTMITLNCPWEKLGKRNVDMSDPEVINFLKLIMDGARHLSSVSSSERRRLADVGRQLFDLEQTARRGTGGSTETNDGDDGAFYGGNDDDRDDDEVNKSMKKATLNSAAADAYTASGQARTALSLTRTGLLVSSLERVCHCDKCQKDCFMTILCQTCDSVTGCYLCPACDSEVHLISQDHQRHTLTCNNSNIPSLRPLGPSEFMAQATSESVSFTEENVVLKTLPSSISLTQQLTCGCWRARAADWVQTPFTSVLSVHGVMRTGRVTRVVCSCGITQSLPAKAVLGIEHSPITLERTRCALSSTVAAVIVAAQSGDVIPSAGSLRRITEALCGYAPPPKVFADMVRQMHQLNTLAFNNVAAGGVACIACADRGGGVLHAVDGSCAGFRYQKTGGFVASMVTAYPTVASNASVDTLLTAAGRGGGDDNIVLTSVCSGASSDPNTPGASTWAAADGSNNGSLFKDENGIFIRVCAHGVVARAQLMPGPENTRYHLGAIMERLAEVTSAAGATSPFPLIVQSDISCQVIIHLVAQLREDSWYFSRVFGDIYPSEAGRAIVVTIESDYKARAGGPTVTLTFGERLSTMIGDPRLPSGVFTVKLYLIIGGMHAPAHCCCWSLHQHDLIGLPLAGTASEMAEWGTALIHRNAPQARPLGKGQFRLFWEVAFAQQQDKINFASPYALGRYWYKARVALIDALEKKEAAILAYNTGRGSKQLVTFENASRVVDTAVAAFRAPITVGQDVSISARRLKETARVLKLSEAAALLRSCVSMSQYGGSIIEEETHGALPKRPRSSVADAGADLPESTAQQRALFSFASNGSEVLKAARSFNKVRFSTISDPREAVKVIRAIEAWIEAQGPTRQIDVKTILSDKIFVLRFQVGALAALRIKCISATKKNGDGDGQVLKLVEAIRSVSKIVNDLRDTVQALAKQLPQYSALANLPSAKDLKGENFDDVKFVPLTLQPPKAPQETMWSPLFMAVRTAEAAQHNLIRVSDDVINAVRTVQKVLDDVSTRSKSLAASIVSSSGVTYNDLVIAASSSLLFVEPDMDIARTPFTVPFGDSNDLPVLARGLLSTLTLAQRKWDALHVQLRALSVGLQAVDAVSPVSQRLPVDSLGRTYLGQRIRSLLNGSMKPAEWAKLSLAETFITQRENDESMQDHDEDEEDEDDGDGSDVDESDKNQSMAESFVAAAEDTAIHVDDNINDDDDAEAASQVSPQTDGRRGSKGRKKGKF